MSPTKTQSPPRTDAADAAEQPRDLAQQLAEIEELVRQQQRRTTWLVIAVLLMAITNLDLIGNALRMVLYALLIVGILGGVYWFALQRGRQGKSL